MDNCSFLPQTFLPTPFLEQDITLEEARKSLQMGGHISIRQVTSMDRKLEVRERMKKRYAFKNYPDEFTFRCKCIVVFQNLDGVDVMLFGLYVYEHDESNPEPNKRTVYISYLDSVHYMRPRKMRTFIYHEIMIAYLESVRKRGFSTAHIWACPPVKGDDYILYAKPEDQKVPKDDRLRQWYVDMLVECQKRGIVGKLTNMYDLYFSNEKNDATVVPYMDGDYFPAEVENIIKDIEEGKTGKKKGASQGKKKKQNNTSKSKKKNGRGGTRSTGLDEEALKASGYKPPGEFEDRPLEEGGRDYVMVKLGETIQPMKESFILAYLSREGANPEDMVVPKAIQEYREKHGIATKFDKHSGTAADEGMTDADKKTADMSGEKKEVEGTKEMKNVNEFSTDAKEENITTTAKSDEEPQPMETDDANEAKGAFKGDASPAQGKSEAKYEAKEAEPADESKLGDKSTAPDDSKEDGQLNENISAAPEFAKNDKFDEKGEATSPSNDDGKPGDTEGTVAEPSDDRKCREDLSSTSKVADNEMKNAYSGAKDDALPTSNSNNKGPKDVPKDESKDEVMTDSKPNSQLTDGADTKLAADAEPTSSFDTGKVNDAETKEGDSPAVTGVEENKPGDTGSSNDFPSSTAPGVPSTTIGSDTMTAPVTASASGAKPTVPLSAESNAATSQATGVLAPGTAPAPDLPASTTSGAPAPAVQDPMAIRKGKFAAMAKKKRDVQGNEKAPAEVSKAADKTKEKKPSKAVFVKDSKGRTVKVLDDDDEEMDCEFLNNRQAFLNLCQGNHYQFDQLRRAKHSSMMVLWHLHNRDAPKFVQQCATCSREILTGYRFHCDTCADFDQCQDCVQNPKVQRHPHQLKPIPVTGANQPELTEEQRKERQRSIQLHMTLLQHAATCTSAKCPSANCTKMKGLLKHGASCQIKATGGCNVCKRIWALLQIHARQCKASSCPVPNCMAIRERVRQLKKQQQAMDDRRRQEMNRAYHR